ncbi:hypothetical protein MSPP1_003075 [Malassezia sp. CBS 17886]|nr:hypothetical protein MSPP1_003075 [Malassezia sp. CBS 17886]
MEAQLQSLKVAELKDLLIAASLPVTGNKPDLVKRLLEHPEATKKLEQEADASGAADTSPAAAVNAAEDAQPSAASAPSVSGSAPAAGDAAPVAAVSSDATAATPSAEERKQTHLAELEKRKARALRFGMPTEELEQEIKRVTEFGPPETASNTDKVAQELRRGKKGGAAPEKKSEQPATPAVSEEERARRQKRAERFGVVSAEEEDKKRRRTERFDAETAQA